MCKTSTQAQQSCNIIPPLIRDREPGKAEARCCISLSPIGPARLGCCGCKPAPLIARAGFLLPRRRRRNLADSELPDGAQAGFTLGEAGGITVARCECWFVVLL